MMKHNTIDDGLHEIRLLLKKPHGEANFKRLDAIATNWFIALDSRRIGGTPELTVTKAQAMVQKFVFEINGMGRRSIPFALWSDIADQGMSLLLDLIDRNELDYKNDPKFKQFKKLYYERVDEIAKNPKFAAMFGDGYY